MKTLILTLPPHIKGGVASKAKILADTLKSYGHQVTLGVYAAYSRHPELNVGLSGALAMRGPKTAEISGFEGHRCVAVGCNIPEFEHNYTAGSAAWQDLISSHDRHIAVGGTVLIAHPLVRAGVKHLVWCAADINGDRLARQNQMGFLRQAIDRLVVVPRLKQQERAVLACDFNRILGVSPFTVSALSDVYARPQASMSVMPIPTDFDFFVPAEPSPETLTRPILGFAGRLDDPRKNAPLLFQTIAQLVARGIDTYLHVTGETSAQLDQQIAHYGLSDRVTFFGNLSVEELRKFYQSLSLYVFASYQEGLGIAGIEAMACGVPVLSTRCGGPEAYINHRHNGFLSDFSSSSMADCALEIFANDLAYQRISQSARTSVMVRYAHRTFADKLHREWSSLWSEDIRLSTS